MTLDEAIRRTEMVAEIKEKQIKNGDWEKDSLTERNCIKSAEEHRQLAEWLRDYKRLKEQEPCEDTISRQNDILPNIDKEVESYKKLLKHPVVKSIMGMDETQEQLDFVQPHKRIPVTLTVSGELISREAVCDYIAEFINHEYSTQSECEMVDSMIDGIQHMQSVKPQTGHWILKIEDWNKWICSKCGYTERTDIHVSLGYDFCPKCGAKMSKSPTDAKDVIWYSKRNYSEIVVEPQERSDKE